METYQTYRPIAYPPSDKGMPVPGWDMRRLLAGSPTIAIGALPSQSKAMIIQGRSPFSSRGIVIQGKQAAYHGLGLDMTIQTPVGPQQVSIPIEDAMNAAMAGAVSQMWPQLQPKLDAELDAAVAKAQATMNRNMLISTLLVAGLVVYFGTKKR